jgi:hypothetical protein
MRRLIMVAAVAAACAVPVIAGAATPNSTDKQNAAKLCKSLLKAEGTNNFTHAWGAHGKGRAYGKCVSAKARDEAQERQDAHDDAVKQCKAEDAMTDDAFKADHGGQTFAQFYGAKNDSSAFGKCVSTHAKENKAEADQEDQDTVNAARLCRGEQKSDPATFKSNYRNFGKCVSKKAHELTAQRKQQESQTTS